MNEHLVVPSDRIRRWLRLPPFWISLVVVLAVTFALMDGGFRLGRSEIDGAERSSYVEPTSEIRAAVSTTPQAQSEDSALGWRLVLATAYIGMLGAAAVAIRYRRRLFCLPQAVSTKEGEPIVVRQSKRVTPQLTLVVVEVSGRKLLVAASPHAISTTVLEDR